jgi:cathepsin F
MEDGMKYFETTGFELESDYKYTGMNGKCKSSSYKSVGKVVSYHKISTDETEIAKALAEVGPLSIAVNASWF